MRYEGGTKVFLEDCPISGAATRSAPTPSFFPATPRSLRCTRGETLRYEEEEVTPRLDEGEEEEEDGEEDEDEDADADEELEEWNANGDAPADREGDEAEEEAVAGLEKSALPPRRLCEDKADWRVAMWS